MRDHEEVEGTREHPDGEHTADGRDPRDANSVAHRVARQIRAGEGLVAVYPAGASATCSRRRSTRVATANMRRIAYFSSALAWRVTIGTYPISKPFGGVTRTAGRSIGRGAVERAIKQLLNLRMKRTGARWRVEHVGPLVELRAASQTAVGQSLWNAAFKHRPKQ